MCQISKLLAGFLRDKTIGIIRLCFSPLQNLAIEDTEKKYSEKTLPSYSVEGQSVYPFVSLRKTT